MDHTSLLTFKAIVGFISDLNDEFGLKYKSIALYNRLLSKTGINNTEPIHKHIDCFKTFFSENLNALETQNEALFSQPKISYSSNVYVDIRVIFKHSTKENAKVIWQHLLTIWGLVDQTSKAKKILNEMSKNQGGDKETKFFTNILEKVEKSVSQQSIDTKNPMAAVTSLLSSGVFNDIIVDMQQGMADGSFDIGKLMGNVQGMMTDIGMSGGGNANGGGGGLPGFDIGSIMGMMSNLNFPSNDTVAATAASSSLLTNEDSDHKGSGNDNNDKNDKNNNNDKNDKQEQ